MRKKGISLIVLIITIIVVIILAAVVILTLSKNNPIESAKEARFKEDVRTFQDELALAVSKQYTTAGGHRDEKISTSNFDEIKEYIPSFSEKYRDKFIIQDDELRYTKQLDDKEKEYAQSLNFKKYSILPSEYQQIEYIESTGTQYIDTKITIQSGLTMECDIAQIGGNFVNSVIYNSQNSIYYIGWNPNNGLLYYIYLGNTRQSSMVSLEKNRMYHIKTILKDGFQSMEVDGNVLKSTSISGDIIIENKNLLLFGGIDELGNVLCKMRLGSIRYLDNNNIMIRDFIPCYSTTTVTDIDGNQCQTGTIGMYDTVEGKFYTNQGTGEDFIPGPDVD